MKYWDVIDKVYHGDLSKVPDRLFCLDPGETTGWCLFEKAKLTRYGQIDCVDIDKKPYWLNLDMTFMDLRPTHVVCENYRVYSHKLERHSFSEVPTLRLIGGIDYMCWRDHIDIAYQMAVQAKGFATDERLKEWDFWKEGMRHSRDAIRHGIYFLIITNRPKEGVK